MDIYGNVQISPMSRVDYFIERRYLMNETIRSDIQDVLDFSAGLMAVDGWFYRPKKNYSRSWLMQKG